MLQKFLMLFNYLAVFWMKNGNNKKSLCFVFLLILQSDDPNATIAVILDSFRALVRLDLKQV